MFKVQEKLKQSRLWMMDMIMVMMMEMKLMMMMRMMKVMILYQLLASLPAVVLSPSRRRSSLDS